MKKKNKSGFTLTEVIVVVAVLAIIIMVAIPSISSSVDRSVEKKDQAMGSVFKNDGGLYVSKYKSQIEVNTSNKCYISVNDLINDGYLEEEDIEDYEKSCLIYDGVNFSFSKKGLKFDNSEKENGCESVTRKCFGYNIYSDNNLPRVEDLTVRYDNTIKISGVLKDDSEGDSGIMYYAVTTSSSRPKTRDWKKVSNTKVYNLNDYEVTDYRVYYVWAKDAAGNINKAEIDTMRYIDKPTTSLCSARVYDGTLHQLTSVTNGEGYVLSDYNGVDAGSYTVTAELLEGYRWKDKSSDDVEFQCSISKRQLDVSKFTYSPLTKVYDGTVSVPSGFGVAITIASNLISGDNVGINYSSATYTDANVGTNKTIKVSGMTLVGTDKNNYSLSSNTYNKNGASIIAKELLDVSISPSTYTYDGKAKTPTVTVNDESKKLVKDTDYTVSVTNNVNVGTGTVTVTGTGNYKGTVTKEFTISKANSSVTLTASAGTYTGSTISANSADVTGSSGARSYVYYTNSSCTSKTSISNGATSSGKAPIDAGTYYVKVTVASDENYKSASSSCVKHEIKAKSVNVLWEEKINFTYNGSEQGPTATAAGVTGETMSLTRVGAITVGEHTATVTCSSVTGGRAKCANYSLVGDVKKFIIFKFNSTIALDDSTSVYTGSAISANSAVVTGTSGTINYVYYTNSACTTETSTSVGAASSGKAPVDVGTYYVKATAASDTNHTSATSSCVKHVIKAKSVDVIWGETVNFNYDGSAKAPTVSVTGVTGETVNVTRTTATAVGNYTSTATCSSVTGGRAKCGNYSLTSNTKNFKISYKTYTITLDMQSGSGGSTLTYGRYADGVYLDSGYGKKMTTSANNITVPTRSGYTFNGYYTKSGGSGTQMISSTGYIKSSLTNTTFNADQTLYAYWTGYQCSLDNKVYATNSSATSNCKQTVTDTLKSNTTYSCPAGYTCSGNTCNASSSCTKDTVYETYEWYYCPHSKTYQTTSTCSYTVEEYAIIDLSCNVSGQSVSYYNYTCDSGTKSGDYCYLYNRTSCPAGWSSYENGQCAFRCGKSGGGVYSQCDGTAQCGSVYSCVSTVGKPGITIGGSNCLKQYNYYTCYKTVKATPVYADDYQYKAGDYMHCKSTYQDGSSYDDGLKCTDNKTLSCTYEGYTLSNNKILATDCKHKITKDGEEYCSTAEYWTGKTCTSDVDGGASAMYNRTCTKTGDKYYYCGANDKYLTDDDDCILTETEDLSSDTTYSCSAGYICSGSSCTASSTCSKVNTGTVTEVH